MRPYLKAKKGHGAVDLVVVFQTAHLVVLVQAVLQLRLQLIVGLVADAQHVHAVVLQLPAELPVVRREVRGDKNKILHNFASSFLEYPLFAVEKPLSLANARQLPYRGEPLAKR